MKRRSVPLVALLLLAGCATRVEPAPKPVVCMRGHASFEAPTTSPLLTGVTPVLEATTQGMTLDDPYVEINTRTAGVVSGAGVPAHAVYDQMAAEEVDRHPLVDYGTVHSLPVGESVTFDRAGRFVGYEWIRAVSARFTYTCGGAQSTGVVTSWQAVGRVGSIDCDTSDDTATGDQVEIIRQVRRLRCG